MKMSRKAAAFALAVLSSCGSGRCDRRDGRPFEHGQPRQGGGGQGRI